MKLNQEQQTLVEDAFNKIAEARKAAAAARGLLFSSSLPHQWGVLGREADDLENKAITLRNRIRTQFNEAQEA